MTNKRIIIKNKDGATYCVLPKTAKEYIEANSICFDGLGNDFKNAINGVEVRQYNTSKFSDVRFKPVIISFETVDLEDDLFLLDVSSEDNSFSKHIETSKRKIYLYNLYPNRRYFYTITAKGSGVKSKTYSFVIKDTYRLIYTPNSMNIRDIGGKKTLSGKTIKYGLLYRGAELTTRKFYAFNERKDHGLEHIQIVHKCDLPYFYELGLAVDLDLRNDNEAGNITKSPIYSNEHPIQYERVPIDAYQWFFKNGIEKESYREKYKKIFNLFANADKSPVYVHCWGGADRTGTLCFILEAILGVSLKDLIIDFELTHIDGNKVMAKPFDPNYSFFYHEEQSFYWMHKWLLEYLDENETIQDGMIRFLTTVIGIDKEVIEKIKTIFLE